jgi:hypothetical protein
MELEGNNDDNGHSDANPGKTTPERLVPIRNTGTREPPEVMSQDKGKKPVRGCTTGNANVFDSRPVSPVSTILDDLPSVSPSLTALRITASDTERSSASCSRKIDYGLLRGAICEMKSARQKLSTSNGLNIPSCEVVELIDSWLPLVECQLRDLHNSEEERTRNTREYVDFLGMIQGAFERCRKTRTNMLRRKLYQAALRGDVAIKSYAHLKADSQQEIQHLHRELAATRQKLEQQEKITKAQSDLLDEYARERDRDKTLKPDLEDRETESQSARIEAVQSSPLSSNIDVDVPPSHPGGAVPRLSSVPVDTIEGDGKDPNLAGTQGLARDYCNATDRFMIHMCQVEKEYPFWTTAAAMKEANHRVRLEESSIRKNLFPDPTVLFRNTTDYSTQDFLRVPNYDIMIFKPGSDGYFLSLGGLEGSAKHHREAVMRPEVKALRTMVTLL